MRSSGAADPTGSGNAEQSAHSGYSRRVTALREDLAALPPDAPVRLAKRTSNLFRPRTPADAGLDVSSFDHVLSVDPVARTADVEGMVTYEQLVDAALPHGLMPLVVPQLKTITLGGAVTGLGIESSSFRAGMPHESVLEMDILTGDGDIVTATPDGEHSDLFFAFPNSYGTLGYALRLRIELAPVRPYVRLDHVRFSDSGRFFDRLARACREHEADFVDGTVFAPGELYLTLGSLEGEPDRVSDYTWLDIYYRSIRERPVDHLPVRDYLWRWDTDWFWCSRALGAQNRLVRLLAGPRLLRSDVYWKVVDAERRHGWLARASRLLGRPERESVMQDVEVPIGRAGKFLSFLHREIPISPIWICPLRQRDSRRWPLYELDPDELYVNFGFWGTVPLAPGESQSTHNRRIEEVVTALGGRKSLYSESFYDPDTFWQLYNGPAYRAVKQRYDPGGRLLDLYAKCVQAR
ncbi:MULTISPECIES: FAD-binding oxidoreductase [Prauserella salsuginis group]|uniref:Delta(24)-sterol reductase n=1 Tax=Prauserella salsuginis TaxID=387889 RepID=A0ABW6G992_9PSEU|nr:MULTISPECIES: FAD-binding oxidoreductase [Prauserella salsuginis group]MCR3719488.1 FAD/FMN-containing dehydrogenase [Prauserella flava]MCR3735498.1 FAD/FMN-containing dehydrogenase [Prauserella salsuginis]